MKKAFLLIPLQGCCKNPVTEFYVVFFQVVHVVLEGERCKMHFIVPIRHLHERRDPPAALYGHICDPTNQTLVAVEIALTPRLLCM